MSADCLIFLNWKATHKKPKMNIIWECIIDHLVPDTIN